MRSDEKMLADSLVLETQLIKAGHVFQVKQDHGISPHLPCSFPGWLLKKSRTLLRHSPELSIFHLQLQLFPVARVNVVPLRRAGVAGERQ